MRRLPTILCPVFFTLLVAGCASNQAKVLDSGISQVEIRSYQSRAVDTTDRERVLRSVIATLQDLDFLVVDANAVLGTVSAGKYDKNREIKITVSVRPRGETQTLVRASMEFLSQPVHDAEPYRQFFTSLDKAMFLTTRVDK